MGALELIECLWPHPVHSRSGIWGSGLGTGWENTQILFLYQFTLCFSWVHIDFSCEYRKFFLTYEDISFWVPCWTYAWLIAQFKVWPCGFDHSGTCWARKWAQWEWRRDQSLCSTVCCRHERASECNWCPLWWSLSEATSSCTWWFFWLWLVQPISDSCRTRRCWCHNPPYIQSWTRSGGLTLIPMGYPVWVEVHPEGFLLLWNDFLFVQGLARILRVKYWIQTI